MIGAVLVAFLASTVHAQRNCNITSPAFDSPISFGTVGGWRMPRIGWHALAAGEAVVVARGAQRMGVSRRLAGWIAPALSLIVHAIGVSTHRYRLNVRDVGFDVAVRSGAAVPLLYAAAGYLAAVCWSSP